MEPVRAVPPPGRPEPPRANSLRTALELARLLQDAGYEPQRIQQRLATGDHLLARSPELPSYLRRLGDADELAVLLRLFLLGVPVSRARFDELVGAVAAQSWKSAFVRTARSSMVPPDSHDELHRVRSCGRSERTPTMCLAHRPSVALAPLTVRRGQACFDFTRSGIRDPSCRACRCGRDDVNARRSPRSVQCTLTASVTSKRDLVASSSRSRRAVRPVVAAPVRGRPERYCSRTAECWATRI